SAKKLQCFFKYLSSFHDRNIGKIRKEDIQRLYTSIVTQNGHTANRVLSLIKVIISYGIQHGNIEADVNGILTIKKAFKEQPRTNFLSLADAKKLMAYLDENIKRKTSSTLERQHHLIYIVSKALILTGQRKQNVLQMEKTELDIDSGIWTIPPAKNKTSREVTCHLVPELVELLQPLLEKNENSNYVFVNPKTGRPFTEIRKTWSRIQKDLNISATIHDLRRTCASLHVRHGASIKQIADTLGDSSLDMVSRVYAKTEASILRENANKLSKLIYD
ncbi:MAG: site-specific integrase, partial [Victivallaceae bacterium]|nr:site-specific integrase [Victivallaceae bacterium]